MLIVSAYRRLRNWVKRSFWIVVEAGPHFCTTEGQLRASALTYYSLFAIVPIFALLFGIAKGFGLEEWLKNELMLNLAGQREILEWLYRFADTTLREAKGGWIAGIGLIALFWTVVKMIGNIESAFNRVWEVRKQRSIFRKFTDYLSFVLIAPVLLLAAGSASVFVSAKLRTMAGAHEALATVSMPLIELGMMLAPYVLSWLLFAFIYAFLPNTRVKLSAALFGGIIAGTVCQLMQSGYIYIQMALSRYNVIYGSLSALPLFLIWMYLSWLVVLIGVVLAYLYQNFDYESRLAKDHELTLPQRRELALLLTIEVADDFAHRHKPSSQAELAARCRLSESLTCELLTALTEARVLSRVEFEEYGSACYQPALPLEELTIFEILSRLDGLRVPAEHRKVHSPFAKKLENTLHELTADTRKSPANRRVSDFFKA